MPTVTIEQQGCRYCSLCHDICPTDVFDMDEAAGLAVATRPQDCIGCTSCEYICPSRCLSVGDCQRQRPFHRIEENANIVARFLQQTPVTSALSDADLAEALQDVAVRLSALGDSVTDTMGRGNKAVGRRAGKLSAAHLPEMYEGRNLNETLKRLQHRFKGSFAFAAEVSEEESRIGIHFDNCALARVVTAHGQEPGRAVLCTLFHGFWAGLLSEFTHRQYALEAPNGGPVCSLRLTQRD
jgi:NAD-dependent dihydropyrimidine dehydrogenase PreA subunit/predicted hydrocarbon binding protein